MKTKKRESILITAKHMFARYGVRKTNLNEIAYMARVAKATIYNYFGSKEQVYFEVLKREANELMDEVSEATAQITSPLEKLRVFYRTRIAKMKEVPNILTVPAEGDVPLWLQTSLVREGLLKREIALIQSILEEGVKAGVFYMDNIFRTARALGYALRGLESTLPAGLSREEMEADFEGLFEVFCRGILVEKREG